MSRLQTKIDWTKVDPFLAELSTNEIRERFGIKAPTSIWRRRKLGIPVVKGRRKKRIWELRIKWAEIDKYLGVLSDREVANKFNISESSVSVRRQKLGITLKRSPLRYSQLDWGSVIDLLGKTTDTEIAEIMGVTVSLVGYKRKQLKIKKYTGVLKDKKKSYTLAKRKSGKCKYYKTEAGNVQGTSELAYIKKLIEMQLPLPKKCTKPIETPYGYYIPDFEFKDRYIEIKSDYTFDVCIGKRFWCESDKKRKHCQMEKINYVREYIKPVQIIIVNK